MTCSEDYNLKVFGQGSKQINSMGSDVDSSLDLLSCWELYLYLDIMRILYSIVTVNKGLVQIEDY